MHSQTIETSHQRRPTARNVHHDTGVLPVGKDILKVLFTYGSETVSGGRDLSRKVYGGVCDIV